VSIKEQDGQQITEDLFKMAKRSLKILMVFGTRPEVIKMAPIIKQMRKYPGTFICRICITGQHREMVAPLLKLFNIEPHYDLKVMVKGQGLEHITNTVLSKIGRILDKEQPDYLVVQGDTTTAMAASLAAFYHKVKIAHVEAGLRTWDNLNPYPEETNRRIIDSVADLFFAHSKQAKANLLKEGIAESKIMVTGNTVIDALLDTARKSIRFKDTALNRIVASDKKLILVTAHRRESFGPPFINICKAIREVALRFPDKVNFVYPVHLNPNVQKPVYSLLKGLDNVLLTEPLEYAFFVQLMKRSYFILTDSGGIQEEAPSLGKPVLVIRETTERPEAVKAGVVKIIGTGYENIVKETVRLLMSRAMYRRMSKSINPYGDGKASLRIADTFRKGLKNNG
jgi:UDP-N-acetylglucosamine 2-epimerase (non-hydrolysing)